MNKPIKKAVFPVGGLGLRFLPITKAIPKEMLPIIDKPLIQYAVTEAISAGIDELIFVTCKRKRAIEEHFDSNLALEKKLELEGKTALLNIVREILPHGVSCSYVQQADTLGLGHAVLTAKPFIGDEPFAVLLADDLIDGDGESCLQQMMSIHQKTQQSVIAIQEVPPEDISKYGIVQLNARGEVQKIIEKPTPENAPSNLGVVGRYILTPAIFSYLEKTIPGSGGEIQLTDAIAKLLNAESVTACLFKGKRYDCGTKVGYLQATIAHALKDPELCAVIKKCFEDSCRSS